MEVIENNPLKCLFFEKVQESYSCLTNIHAMCISGNTRAISACLLLLNESLIVRNVYIYFDYCNKKTENK